MRTLKIAVAKLIIFLALVYSNTVCAALAPSFVKIEEIRDKGLMDILQDNIVKGFVLFGAVMGAYLFLKICGDIVDKFGEIKKTGEWSAFIPVLIFGLITLAIAALLIYFGLDSLPK